MRSGAYWSISHGAARILTLLVCGRTEQQNGRYELTDTHAEKLGLRSHDLLARSMPELIRVGLVVQTRRVRRKAKHAAHYAVTWMKVYFIDGVKLDVPEPATHAYLRFERAARTFRGSTEIRSPRSSGNLTPTIGVKSRIHHPDSPTESASHHPDSRGTLKSLGGCTGFSVTLARLSARLRAPISIRKAEAKSGEARSSERNHPQPSHGGAHVAIVHGQLSEVRAS